MLGAMVTMRWWSSEITLALHVFQIPHSTTIAVVQQRQGRAGNHAIETGVQRASTMGAWDMPPGSTTAGPDGMGMIAPEE